MHTTIHISTGEVKVGDSKTILFSNAIGSCVVITAVDIEKGIGALAHVMLPGKAPSKEKQLKTKYALDAIDKMLQLLQENDCDLSNIYCCLIGGGNVLKKRGDTICESNIQSVTNLLAEKQINVSERALGGTLRRTVRFDVENAAVYYTEGESDEMLLWRWNKRKIKP